MGSGDWGRGPGCGSILKGLGLEGAPILHALNEENEREAGGVPFSVIVPFPSSWAFMHMPRMLGVLSTDPRHSVKRASPLSPHLRFGEAVCLFVLSTLGRVWLSPVKAKWRIDDEWLCHDFYCGPLQLMRHILCSSSMRGMVSDRCGAQTSQSELQRASVGHSISIVALDNLAVYIKS